ncbi:glycoside hydrolase family protein [Parafrankia sp. BMG5.11]|uniref:glycoside hydrolase family protein n=2 Tax=Frankiaceae TaxID=74712 RepID=UPI000DA51A1F|nr:glycoside hydrolase family protein [Parafrankia sp. BMG5.11]TCJ35934.1 glycosyl hydrolase [Parafrankia sp. BMG5.11]SQD95530.1 Glycosyl hydrolase 53 domain protein [Parafrankia sp. Ea1.12]
MRRVGVTDYDAGERRRTANSAATAFASGARTHRAGSKAIMRRTPSMLRLLSMALLAMVALAGCVTPIGGGGGPAPTTSAAPSPAGPTGSPSAGPTQAPDPSSGPNPGVTPVPTLTSEPVTTAPVTTAPGATPSAAPVPTTPGSTDPPVGTVAKGASTWYFDKIAPSMTDAGVSWFYTWGAAPERIAAPAGVEFVPMIWGPGSVTPQTLATVKANGRTLLGFNEPDLRGQADMPVQTALDLWPQLEATGMRLGSPAPAAGAADPNSWFGQFMAGAAQRGYKVDFIALHWYGSDFDPTRATSQLRAYIQDVYDRYHLPIWLTEYSLMNFSTSPATVPSAEGQAAFVTASTAMLESLPFVERYAWFAFPANPDSRTGLYDESGQPTPAGVAYRAAGR